MTKTVTERVTWEPAGCHVCNYTRDDRLHIVPPGHPFEADFDWIAHFDDATVTITDDGGTFSLDIETGYGPDAWHQERTNLPSITAAKEEAYRILRPVQVGDIFYSAWGYDQTNIDFYEVVSVTPKSVRVLRTQSRYTGESSGTYDYKEPIPGQYASEWVRKPTPADPWFSEREVPAPKLHRLKWSQGQAFFTVTDYANAYRWDGKPRGETNPAFGH